MKIKHKYTGKSLLELREQFGTGQSGFWNNTWWLKEDFAKEKPEAGVYEIDFTKKFVNLSYEEQKDKLEKDWEFPHPAVLTEAVLEHYKKTGERLLEDWCSRTSSVDSIGDRVCIGYFYSGGLDVSNGYWYGIRFSGLGLSASRKLKIDNRNLIKTRQK